MKYLNSLESKKYDALCRYTDHFSEDELKEFEDEVFGSLEDKKRVAKEFIRLKTLLKQKPDFYAKYMDNIVEVERLLKIMDFDDTVIDNVGEKIVDIQLDINIDVRLFSYLPRLQRYYEYLNFSRYKEIEAKGRRSK